MLSLYVAYGHGEHGPPLDAVYPRMHEQDVTPLLLLVLQVCVAAATHCSFEYPSISICVFSHAIDAVCNSAVVHEKTCFVYGPPLEPVHVRAIHDIWQACQLV